MNKDAFFATIRRTLFDGRLNQSQVDGINALLAAFDRHGITDRRQQAYMLATAKWETAHTMQPIREYGRGIGKPYGNPDPETGHIYYGRGYVQLTHKYNYRVIGKMLRVNLVDYPSRALEPELAADILVVGMRDGLFDTKNGVPLSHYLNSHKADWWNARRTVNIIDKAGEIAVIAQKFDAALSEDNVEPSAPSLDYQSHQWFNWIMLAVFVSAMVFIVAKIAGIF